MSKESKVCYRNRRVVISNQSRPDCGETGRIIEVFSTFATVKLTPTANVLKYALTNKDNCFIEYRDIDIMWEELCLLP
jgi:hypothetical protein